MRVKKKFGLFLLLAGVSGCGGGTVGMISIEPDRVTLAEGQQQVFQVTVSQCTDTHVSWSVREGSQGGTISSDGAYTAPYTPGIYHVEAECVRNSRVNTVAEVTVNGPDS